MDRSHNHEPSADGVGRDAGFTLHEVLVVVALVGIILAVALPNLRRSQIRAELLDDVKLVHQALMVGRMHALKSGRRVVVALAPSLGPLPGQPIVAWVDDDGDDVQDPGDRVLGSWLLGTGALIGPDETAPEWSLRGLPGDRSGVVFLPDGTAIAHGTDIGIGVGSVVVSDFRDNRIRLTIAAGAGTVREQMWDPEAASWSDELRFWRY